MDAKVQLYIPHCFNSFQGFSVKDIKEHRSIEHMEVILEAHEDRVRLCLCCGHKLGIMKDRYWVKARHLRVFNWTVSVCFWREKRHCSKCKKTRSEWIDFICPTSPHMTLVLAWWINRMSEISTVLQVSKLESIDKLKRPTDWSTIL